MTKQEFYTEYLRLNRAFPDVFFINKPTKLQSLYCAVETLDKAWMKSFVNRVLKQNNPKLSIFEAASGEIKAMSQKAKTEEILRETVVVCDESLKSALEKIGATSIIDAIESGKFKKISLE